jgi:Coenzyme PQQ synthesis protein D (PqqD)
MNTRYAASKNVIARTIGEETVLLNIETEAYFGLNEVGSLVWGLLTQGTADIDAIVNAVIERFEVQHALARNDVEALLAGLLDHELIEAQP